MAKLKMCIDTLCAVCGNDITLWRKTDYTRKCQYCGSWNKLNGKYTEEIEDPYRRKKNNEKVQSNA